MQNTFDLFSTNQDEFDTPLADRCRPKDLDQVVGHEKYLRKGSPLSTQIESGKLPSLIFWGPPGVGKTTIARIIVSTTNLPFSTLSAVTSGKKDLKEIIDKARIKRKGGEKGYILFIDEIHRYNKAQQDGLLHAVEDGTIKLIGATTENPSFEIISPLLSRCQVIKLEPLNKNELEKILLNCIKNDRILSDFDISISDIDKLLFLGSGDARRILNLLDICINLAKKDSKEIKITSEIIKKAAEQNVLIYDKKGDYHYDAISAFIKSVRGSDPDAAVYYLARMLESGEDPIFIARRLIILASEDIGNAEPYALSLATAGMQAVHVIGMPEARIVLAQVATYLASCPKSNASYLAISEASKEVTDNPTLQIPLHLRNAPTKLMKELEYSAGYKYPHNYSQHFIEETYLPDKIKDKVFYRPTELGREKLLKERLTLFWGKNKYFSKKKK